MSWGDLSQAFWGGFEWGTTDEGLFVDFFADGLAQKVDNDVQFQADAVLQETTDVQFQADNVCLGTNQVFFQADAFVARLPTEAYKDRVVKPQLLIELRFPSGTVRVSSRTVVHNKFVWEPRLVNAGEILQGVGQIQDDMRLVIDDTATSGAKITDNFSDATPPEGAGVSVYLTLAGSPVSDRLHIFEGNVEQVVSVSESEVEFEIVRQDAVDDRKLGRVVTLDDFPNAPEESLGSIVPLVFGQVYPHRGIVTNYNARTTLATALRTGDTVAILTDGSEFPSSGSAKVDDEIITWTSKTGDNQLNISARGDSGTQEETHPSRSDIVEQGTFEVVFCDHAAQSIDRVRLPDGRGNLVVPVPDPTIDAPNGKVTWSETPRIRVPSRSTEYFRAGFASATPGQNTATDPEQAAQEALSFSDLGVAQVNGGTALDLQRTADTGTPGEIIRCWAVVVYDPTGFNPGATSFSIPGISQVLGPLSGFDRIPQSVSERDYKTQGVTFQVNDPQHQHAAVSGQTPPVRPNQPISGFKLASQIGNKWVNPQAAFDSDVLTGTSITNPVFPSGIQGREQLVLNGATFSLGSNITATGMRLSVVSGGNFGVAGTNPVAISTFMPGGGFGPGVTVSGNTLQTFRSNFGNFSPLPSGLNPDLSNLSDYRFVLTPIDPGSGTNYGAWFVREIYLEFTTSEQAPPASTGITQRRSVTEYFEITGIVDSDWDFFNDTARGGRLRVSNAGGAPPLRVQNIFYSIEHRPFVFSAGEVPEVYGEVTGLVPDGDALDIMEELITGPDPRGLGLPTTQIDRGRYFAAQTALDADNMRADFAITESISTLEVMATLAENMGLREFWDQAIHNVIRKPDPSNLPAAFKTLRENDIVRGSLNRRRTSEVDIANLIEARFKPNQFRRAFTGSDSQEDAASIAIHGRKKLDIDFELVRDLATVQAEVTRYLARNKFAKWMVQFKTYLLGLEFRQGDIIRMDHREFSFEKAEIVHLALDTTSRPLRVITEAIVWEL